jgi:hypothetical protein
MRKAAGQHATNIKDALAEARALLTLPRLWGILTPSDDSSVVRLGKLRDRFAKGDLGYGELVALAQQGDIDAQKLANNVASSYLARLPNEVLPEPVRSYICEILKRKSSRVQRRGNRAKTDRDAVILIAVEQIARRYEIPETRNPADRGSMANPSACSIVARALSGLGVDLDERGVEDIRKPLRRDKILAHRINPR